MIAYVLDASVAAKWYLPAADEPLNAEALQLLKDYVGGSVNLLVPDLFWPEFTNILWKATRYGRVSVRTAEEAIVAMREREIPTASSAVLLQDAFAIATTSNRTVYDAVYVALAVVSGTPLITADERLANSVAARFPVLWLGAYSSAR